LGHGNDFDYWSPFHVEWLQLTETNWSKQQQEGGGELAWKVKQVGAGWVACCGYGWWESPSLQAVTEVLACPPICHPCLPDWPSAAGVVRA
jgi:hypothetical protein